MPSNTSTIHAQIKRNLAITLQLAREELIDRYSGSILGRIWTLITPLAYILVFILVFSRIMGARLESLGMDVGIYSYSLYLVCGILPWMAFARSIEKATSTFIEKRHLINKVNLSLSTLPMASILSETCIFLISWVFFIIFLAILNIWPSYNWLFLIPILSIQLLLVFSVGLLLATLTVYLRDVKEMTAVALQLGFWCTPIVYTVDILPEKMVAWINLNPVYQLITAYRDVFLHNNPPSITGLVAVLALGCLALFTALWLINRTEKDLRDSL